MRRVSKPSGRRCVLVSVVALTLTLLLYFSGESHQPESERDVRNAVRKEIPRSTHDEHRTFTAPPTKAPILSTAQAPSDPILTLRHYFARHQQDISNGVFSFPVGGQVHLSENNAKGGSSGAVPPLCGVSLMRALNYTLLTDKAEWTPCGEDQCFEVVLSATGATYEDVVLAGRLTAVGVIASGVTRRISSNQFAVIFGPFPHAPHRLGHTLSVDVLLTWVGPFFLGQRWSLPDRNDDPPLETKKAKCLALSLSGACDRFGVAVFSRPSEPWPLLKSSPRRAALCKTDAEISSNGEWERLQEGDTLGTALLDDMVGLNRLNGTAWQWLPSACSLRLFSRENVLQCFQSRGIREVGLFGDSMMVEFVRQLSNLMQASIRQGKHKRLRYMEFDAKGDSGHRIRVRFSRSYTTKEGSSVIASPSTILSQLLATSPDVILGNFAVLHWQQNMMPLSAWEENLKRVRGLLTPVDASRPWQRGRGGNAFYLGPTLIQMGRTQGLEPSRTAAFSAAARRILSDCGDEAAPCAAGFRMFQPMNLSSSRREGAYDGQHWACYHTYGGISQMTTQLWLNQLCNI
ncbi:membrane-associated protein, putative [Bodo saltans]|uniref:Membrane-associated protein, putative n=1 Tax=Bodo saltans TaxID=75058 RepID=A0A0S4J9T1_BODSA|nr:membrane-associated protein, putative [Bodo saltans]|eukprot:CUG86257.1 membrane-associated protein, putative [Bodo saltans]